MYFEVVATVSWKSLIDVAKHIFIEEEIFVSLKRIKN